jgi:hypothetical protein
MENNYELVELVEVDKNIENNINNDVCPICLDYFHHKKKEILLECNHKYHWKC